MSIAKIIKTGSILLIILLIAGCSNKDMEFTTEQATHDIVNLLRGGDYQTVYQEWFSEELKESLSVEGLQSEWKEIIEENGDFVEVSSLEIENHEDNIEIVEGKVEYTNVTFGIRLIFNNDGLLIGFNLSGALMNINMPDSIVEEEILVGEGTAYELGGTITLPKKNQDSLPAVILVHGSGSTDRDESAFAYKPFRDIAWGLAEQGIAVIRYDKRTYVYGHEIAPDLSNLTAYEETVEDAIKASQLAKNDKRIDEDNVFIIGHSLGGMLAPRIDNQGGDFAGITILAGSTRSLWEIVYDQNHYFLDLEITDEKQREEYLKIFEEEYEKGLRLQDITLEESKEMTIFGINGHYLKEMEEHNTESLVQNLEKPILVLQGEEDFQVYYEKDFAIFKDLLGDKENATLISYENLNHLFADYQGSDKGTLREYNHPGKVSQKVIEDIGNWILKNQN